MKDDKTKRKQKIMKFLAISSIVISLVLSSIALHNSSDLDELKSGSDGESSLSRIGILYGTHGCEDGGFSIQVGIDENRDGLSFIDANRDEPQEVDASPGRTPSWRHVVLEAFANACAHSLRVELVLL